MIINLHNSCNKFFTISLNYSYSILINQTTINNLLLLLKYYYDDNLNYFLENYNILFANTLQICIIHAHELNKDIISKMISLLISFLIQ